MDMAGFKYVELTFRSDQMDDDCQRIDVLWLNPVAMETFDACDMSVFWFKGEVVGFLWNKPMHVSLSALSRKFGCKDNSVIHPIGTSPSEC